MMLNPFTPRGAINVPEQFIGRWRELSIIFERLENGRSVLLTGAPGVGKSSLLYHISQAASIHLDDDEMRAYYLNLEMAEDAEEVQRVVLEALGWRHSLALRAIDESRAAPSGLAALEVALIELGVPLLLALDNADAAIAAGWGARLLDGLARIARRGDLLLVAAVGQSVPRLSEPFSVVQVGAMVPTEVRLLAEAYLGESNIRFTAPELRELYALSAGHPAYLQRAAFHLFRARHDPNYDWRKAYLNEALLTPIVGAPLPPEVFSGDQQRRRAELSFSDGDESNAREALQPFQAPSLSGLPLLLLPLVALAAYLLSGSLLVALVALVLVGIIVTLARPRSPRVTKEG